MNSTGFPILVFENLMSHFVLFYILYTSMNNVTSLPGDFENM